MRTVLAVIAISIAFGAVALAEDSDGDWVQLFNGSDLSGWTAKIKGYPAGENFGDTFRVEDGLLKVCYDQYEGKFEGRFGHLFYNRAYSNYVLRAEYRFAGEQIDGGPGWARRNSGFMIHGQTPESMALNQDFPVSIEVQLLGGFGTGTRPTGNLCTPGTHVVIDGELITRHVINSSSETYHGEQWVTVEVEAHGDEKIIHRVNGETVLEYNAPQLDPKDADASRLITDGAPIALKGGTISVQSESHPIHFRKIEIRELH
jgi:hypothetical protein